LNSLSLFSTRLAFKERIKNLIRFLYYINFYNVATIIIIIIIINLEAQDNDMADLKLYLLLPIINYDIKTMDYWSERAIRSVICVSKTQRQ